MLLQAAGPPDLQTIDALQLTETKVLLRRQAAKIAAAVNHAILLTSAGHHLQPGSQRIAIALDAMELHVEIISRPFLRTEHRRRQQVAGVCAPCGYQRAEPPIAEEVGAAGAVALADERKSGCKSNVAESLAVALEQNQRLQAIHQRTAIAKDQIQVAVIIEIAGIAAHGAPALVDSQLTADFGECAVAIVAIHARGPAVRRGLAEANSMDDIFVQNGPAKLHQIEPAVIVDVAPKGAGSDGVFLKARLRAHIGERPIAVVAE